MTRLAPVGAAAAGRGLGPAGPVLAAEPLAVGTPDRATDESNVPKRVEKCLRALAARGEL